MPRRISTVLCDLDGVVWLAHQPIPGAVDAIASLQSTGRRVVFVTNNSVATLDEHESALAKIGVVASGDIVSSSMAAASLIQPGEHVLVTGGPGVAEAVTARGAVAIANDGSEVQPRVKTVDAVVVGLDRSFDYQRLRTAGSAVLAGARLIGTNRDSTYPTADGLEPGGGSIVAAVAAVGGVEPVFAGKPEQPMVDLVLDTVATDPESLLMVGDRPETDGLFARRLGCRFALVASGVSPPGPDTVPDLAAVVEAMD
jgi:HAD superfamily hydrolase (TIGR01450 family)